MTPLEQTTKVHYEAEHGFGSWDTVSKASQDKLYEFMRTALLALADRLETVPDSDTCIAKLRAISTLREEFPHIIEWSDENRCYVGEIPSMPGCIATGDTIEETKAELEAARLEWIDEKKRLAAEKSSK